MATLLRYRELVLAVIIAAMVVGIGLYAPAFATRDSLLGVLNDTAFLFMMALAQANALTRFIAEKWSGRTPAYAHATGIATRSPGRKRHMSSIRFWLSLTRWTTASRCFASHG